MSLVFTAAEVAAMPRVKYSYHWNAKLLALNHTTIRLPEKSGHLKPNTCVVVQLEGIDLYVARVRNRQEMAFGAVPQAMLATDTGYTGDGAMKLFRSFYGPAFGPNTLVTVLTLQREGEPFDYHVWHQLLCHTFSVNAYERWLKTHQNGQKIGHTIAPD
jgi:hypothetical protein